MPLDAKKLKDTVVHDVKHISSVKTPVMLNFLRRTNLFWSQDELAEIFRIKLDRIGDRLRKFCQAVDVEIKMEDDESELHTGKQLLIRRQDDDEQIYFGYINADPEIAEDDQCKLEDFLFRLEAGFSSFDFEKVEAQTNAYVRKHMPDEDESIT